MDRYLVVGNPIKHIKSPSIHKAFAKNTQQDMEYTARLVAKDDFETFIEGFFTGGGKGVNVTLPFKQRAFAMAQHPSAAAKLAGAANTLWRNDAGELCADNTDGVGMVRDITVNLKGRLTGQRLLILGAGGAVRGVLAPILAQRPAEVVIANRTLEKAQQLAMEVASIGKVCACAFTQVMGKFDWLINGTSASLSGAMPPLPQDIFTANARAYDMVYAAGPTPFNTWAMAHGAVQADDGLGMLVEQAAQSFTIWRGLRPDTQHVLASLREQLNTSH